jgi:hypothetical protein
MNITCIAVRDVEQRQGSVTSLCADFLLDGLLILRNIAITGNDQTGLCAMSVPHAWDAGGNGSEARDAFEFSTAYSRNAFAALLARAVCEFAQQQAALRRFDSIAETAALALAGAKPAAGGVN